MSKGIIWLLQTHLEQLVEIKSSQEGQIYC